MPSARVEHADGIKKRILGVKIKDRTGVRILTTKGTKILTPSNISSSASSHTDHPFRKRKGLFSRQQDVDGKMQVQVNKKRTTETQHMHSTQGGKGVGPLRHTQTNNEGTKSDNTGKGKATKNDRESGTTPKTQLDDFLDKMNTTVTFTAEGTRTHCSENHLEGKFNIINLSSHKLTQIESQVLSLGLSFCPNKSWTILKQ